MSNYTYSEIKNILKENQVVTVFFTKLDGTPRVLTGTLSPDIIPLEDMPTGKRPKIQSEAFPDAIAVFDIENEGWRSFRVSSVTNIVVTPASIETLD